MEEKLGKLA